MVVASPAGRDSPSGSSSSPSYTWWRHVRFDSHNVRQTQHKVGCIEANRQAAGRHYPLEANEAGHKKKQTYIQTKERLSLWKKSDHEKQGNLAWLQAKVAISMNSRLRMKTLRKFLKL